MDPQAALLPRRRERFRDLRRRTLIEHDAHDGLEHFVVGDDFEVSLVELSSRELGVSSVEHERPHDASGGIHICGHVFVDLAEREGHTLELIRRARLRDAALDRSLDRGEPLLRGELVLHIPKSNTVLLGSAAAQLVEAAPHGRRDTSPVESVLHAVEEVIVRTELGEVPEGKVDGTSDVPGEAHGDELGALSIAA